MDGVSEGQEALPARQAALGKAEILAQNRAVQGEELLSLTLDRLQGLIAVVNEQNQIVYANSAFADFFGRTPLNSAISRDDGRTWEHIRAVEDDPGCYFAYPSILVRGQEVVLTYYRSTAEATAVSRGGVFELERLTPAYYRERGDPLPDFISAGRELKVSIRALEWFYGMGPGCGAG